METRIQDDSINDVLKKVNYLAGKCKKPLKTKLKIYFKRGNIYLKHGEWSKNKELYNSLTVDPLKIKDIFSVKNIDWKVLGYSKYDIKKFFKFSDVGMQVTYADTKKSDGKTEAFIIIALPDKNRSGEMDNEALLKAGYLSIEKWKEKAIKLLKEKEPLDKAILDVLVEGKKLTENMEGVDEDDED